MPSKEMQTLTDMNQTELESHIDDLHEELFNLKFRNKMRQVDNPLKIRGIRRQIARALTLLNQYETDARQETSK
jgi:large subunit ribosomal protein L29